MFNDQVSLGYMLIAVVIGFAGLIYLLLKYRKSFLEGNLQLTADQAWSEVSDRANKANFSKSDLLFGIWQDLSSTLPILLVKDHTNEIVGRVEFTLSCRKFKISVGNENFDVNFPPTWNRSAHLSIENNKSVLASYLKLNIFGKHQFEIPGYGILISKRPNFNPRIIFDYNLNKNLVGTTQEISSRRRIGRLAVLPPILPLHLRIFILAL